MKYLSIFKENYIIYMIIVNIVALLVFKLDKYKANNKKYRISEMFFYIISLLGGSTGIIFGIILFKHKISKNSFSYKILLFFLVNKLFEYYLFYIMA